MATNKMVLQLLKMKDEKERDRIIAKLSPQDAKFILRYALSQKQQNSLVQEKSNG